MHESRAKVLGHPLHQMLIPLPFGLLCMSGVFDAIHLWTGEGRWATVAYYMIVSGVLSGIVAAIPGLIDWMSLPRHTRAWRIGALHAAGNELVLLGYGLSWLMRSHSVDQPSVWAIVLSYGCLALAGVTGWLGGELVDRMGVGVDPGAHVNAPSSLTGRPASVI